MNSGSPIWKLQKFRFCYCQNDSFFHQLSQNMTTHLCRWDHIKNPNCSDSGVWIPTSVVKSFDPAHKLTNFCSLFSQGAHFHSPLPQKKILILRDPYSKSETWKCVLLFNKLPFMSSLESLADYAMRASFLFLVPNVCLIV